MSYLFYIHDPMCSWCYAFSQSWDALQQELSANIQVVYLLGGLAPDSMEPIQLATQKMVQQAWRRIEQTVPGVQFNWDFWSQNTPIRSTYPACRAILAARKQRDAAELPMIQAIQRAYYQHAKNPALPATLQECAQEIGLDVQIFSADLISPEIEQELQLEMQQARNMDVHSYPSLRLMHGNKVYPIDVDYLNHHTMLEAINRIIAANSPR